MPPLPRLLFVSDRLRAALPVEEAAALALGALPRGAAAILLREKDLGSRPLLGLARRLREVTSAWGSLLLLAGRADVALAAGADGVQLGGDAPRAEELRPLVGRRLLLGVSLHGSELPPVESDFATLAPVFPTSSKPGAPPVGLERLGATSSRTAAPVFALGGVGPEQVRACLRAGAHGVAVRGAVLCAGDPAAAARRFFDAL